jgi:hypothetical protein
MANLRFVSIKAVDSVTIRARFTNTLNPLLNTGNVTVVSNVPGVPDAQVRSVTVRDDFLEIETFPMTPYAAYIVTFQSTDQVTFNSLNGLDTLFEDGITNAPIILGPEEPSNEIRDVLINYQKDSVYSLLTGSIARDIINSQSNVLSRARHDIGQAKNDNYLSRVIVDELKERGKGPYDRLNEEGAYEVLRVGLKETGATASGSISFTSFPSSPITLQGVTVGSEELEAGAGSGTFNNITLTVSRTPVTKLNSVTINYANGDSDTYSIEQYGYQINNPRYDQSFASTLLTLEDNQIRLSIEAVRDGFVPPAAGDTVVVSYDFKDLGRIIDEETVTVSQVLDAVREPTPPISNQFSLARAPVVNANDQIPNSGAIQFLDPQAYPPFSTIHPAFAREIPFRFERLPSTAGEYSVDYSTGTVYVYGAVDNDGSGDYPPVATYKYRNVFVSRLDYTYDTTTYELVASPLRDLRRQTAKISFDFEPTLVPGTDFEPQVHLEVLDERIENRLLSTGSLRVLNAPITAAFRVFNETSGEIYPITRFNDNTVFFRSRVPPRILDAEREATSFKRINNELLIIDGEFVNAGGTRVLRFLLSNNRISNASEDALGSSYNSSVSFSRSDIFDTELYFDGQVITLAQNTDRLTIGQYQIDYENGILYAGVINNQSADVDTINYNTMVVEPVHSHIISVNEIYHSISDLQGVAKRIRLDSFDEGEVVPQTVDRSDERFTNGDTTLSYTINNGVIIVTDDIKNVRNIYDAEDLTTNVSPTNFADGAVWAANVITLASDGVRKQNLLTVSAGPIVTVPFISDGVEIVGVISVFRVNDGYELYDTGGSFSGYNITLSGVGAPSPGDVVSVVYSVGLNGSATPIVDYNRGDYHIDYTYLADEILVSYEYGDNVLDYRNSDSLDEGTEYYVTYRVGALRDALLKNFGSLVDIPVINSFDTTFPRERYRDALTGALQSFTKGPTIPAMKSLVSAITHIDPDIAEAVFNVWSLGIGYLYPNAIEDTGNIQLMKGKYSNGALISQPGQTISFPLSSNFRIEEGTVEFWVIPEWDGIDNDATLLFSDLTKNGSQISASEIFIGASSFNPTLEDNGTFYLNRMDIPSPVGLPAKIYTHTGLFIHYDPDNKQWLLHARDNLANPGGTVYAGKIISSGEVYNVNNIPGLGELNDVLRSGENDIVFTFNLDGYDVLSPDGYVDNFNAVDGYTPGDGYVPGYSFDGIQFMADQLHYFFDWGREVNRNRFSIFKDGRGYLNLHVHDRNGIRHPVTTDISDWRAGLPHHIAASWRMNTYNRMDQLHLFVDGQEVYNIMRFGGRPKATSSDRFRTVKPEIVIGTLTKNVRNGNDLITTQGSAIVESASINFDAEGIVIGDTIHILEDGFATYTILNVSGRFLTLDSVMPTTLSDARFSINEFSAIVETQIDLFTGITVSIIDGVSGDETEIPGVDALLPAYSISKNLFNQNILTLLGNANAGDQIAIRTLGLNHRRFRDRQFVWGSSSSLLRSQLPPPVSLDEAKITKVILPLTPIGPSNAVLMAGTFVASSLQTYATTNEAEGRTLSVRIAGGNVTFSPVVTVTIDGTTESGAISEVLLFTSPGIKTTSEKWKTISGVDVEATPIDDTRDSAAIEINEAYAITESEGNALFPVIRYSYQIQSGLTLSGTGNHIVTDTSGFFAESFVSQLLVITSPGSVAGTYTITSKLDNNNVTVSPTPPVAFSGGTYTVYQASIGRSGFQNGFFTFETAGSVGAPYLLTEGPYDFDYAAYLEVPLDPVSDITAYVGSDFTGQNQAGAIMDEFRTLTRMLDDVRVGETIADNEKSITTDFTSLNPFDPDSETLMLIHFESIPFVNDADLWISSDREFIQSDSSLNGSFEKSLVLLNRNLVLDNQSTLTRSQGSIEFWVSPRYDTFNDPNVRFYFDASGAVIENLETTNRGSITLSGSASRIISVRLQTDKDNTGREYFAGGRLSSDGRKAFLGKPLPQQNTPVKVAYVPSALSGDRISIFKDQAGFINFNVRASGIDYEVRQPALWARDTWHRVMATYKINSSNNQDEIRLFVDGEERGTILFGSGILFGQGIVFGQGFAGEDNSVLTSDINFSDPINQLFIGSDFEGANFAQARFDNIRLSNLARSPLVVGGQARDINYSSNISAVLPVVEDLFTTKLLDFNKLVFKTEDMAILRDEAFGLFNFDITVIDSFDIVLSSAKIQQVLESLIYALKPATSKVNLEYVQ